MPAIHHRTVQVDGVEIFYREAGDATSPTLLLLHGFPTSSRMFRDLIPLSPDAWVHAQWGMDRLGDKEIQFALHANYGSNIERYAAWHEYFAKFQPPALIVWGMNDFVFLPAGAEAYRRDLQQVELHMLNAGHFALETNAAEIAGYIRAFLATRD